jgi:hypothetical protein
VVQTLEVCPLLTLFRFNRQPLDFFGALRSTAYDNQIRRWLKDILKADLASVEEENLAGV